MNNSLHYLLMANHLLFQKSLHAGIKDTNMTPGQPKILDYLLDHDGIVQKEISKFCHIEPATITSVLFGMEDSGLIVRKKLNGNRRNLYVFLTDYGKILAERVRTDFEKIEKKALSGFDYQEKEKLMEFMKRINDNMSGNGESRDV